MVDKGVVSHTGYCYVILKPFVKFTHYLWMDRRELLGFRI